MIGYRTFAALSLLLISPDAESGIRISLGSHSEVVGQQPGEVAPSAAPDFSPTAEASPLVSPLPNGSPQPNRSLTQAERAMLISELQRAQRSEYRSIEHRFKLEIKEMLASQKARFREWNETEKIARRKFFSENEKGPERRTYIQDFQKRRNDFIQLMADEKARRTAEQGARLESLRLDHSSKLKEFREFISRGERPPQSLWP